MNSLPEIAVVEKSERDRAINTIVLSFATDPIARWVWPDGSSYLKAMPRFTAAFGGGAIEHGTAFSAGGGKAAALWLPPGTGPDEAAMEKVLEETLRPEIAEDMAGVLEGMAEFHPHEPHWYLPMIGCDPHWIGKGFGAALMKHALEKCDEDGLPAYLESSNSRNISLYQRHGFEIIGEIQSGASPVLTPMLRQAR